tara:strand:- start:3817 stop:3990 length:174 start_codon:yes stop_codon:yes gene_type:complete
MEAFNGKERRTLGRMHKELKKEIGLIGNSVKNNYDRITRIGESVGLIASQVVPKKIR